MRLLDELAVRKTEYRTSDDLPLSFYLRGRDEVIQFVAEGGDLHEVAKTGINAVGNMAYIHRYESRLDYVRDKFSETLEALIEHGVDLELRDQIGRTPLLMSLPAEAIRMLIKGGADIEARDPYQHNAFFGIWEPEAVDVLADAGLSPNSRLDNGRAPLHSVFQGRLARALIRRGADPNAMDICGNTPLFTNVEHDVITALLAGGANVKHRNQFGETPLHYLCSYSFHPSGLRTAFDKARLLLEAGADPNAQDQEGNTPLHTCEDDGVAEILIAAGADPFILNNASKDASEETRSPAVRTVVVRHMHSSRTQAHQARKPRRLRGVSGR